MSKRWIRWLAALAAGVLLWTAVFPVDPAAAHVSVDPVQAAQGGFAVLTFRVPNERQTTSTTKVEVYFPTDTPIIGTTVRQLPGWTSKVVRGPLPAPVTVDGTPVTEAITSVAWTADNPANAITGSAYQEFGVSVGPLPNVDEITFKALQTYSDGEVVRWIDDHADGQPEPDYPAVVLRLAAGGQALDEHGMPIAGAGTPAATGSNAQIAREAAPSNVALAVAIAALVVAVAALLLSLIRRRNR